jgi:hypothetical protein
MFAVKYVDEPFLYGNGVKFWNIQPNKDGLYKENGWVFRKDGTFSFFDDSKYRKISKIEILKWLADDIKVGENGIINWSLRFDTLNITRIDYKILKLTEDSLLVKTPYSKFGPIDTLVFKWCKECH